MADDEATKKEQDRLMRFMKGGRRASPSGNARPVSWNVHLSGRSVTGAASKSEQDEALRQLQDQIKKEDNHASASPAFSIAVANASTAEQPHDKKPITSPGRVEIKSPLLTVEDQAEVNAFNAFNEQRELERINKWTRGGGKPEPITKRSGDSFERPIPAVLMRFDNEDKGHSEQKREEPKREEPVWREEPREEPKPDPVEKKVLDLTQYQDGVNKFTHNVNTAAKAIRQKHSEALVKACWSVVMSAKTLSLLAGDDGDIISWTKALEAATNVLRTRIDSGSAGQETYSEISNALGQIYLTVISLF